MRKTVPAIAFAAMLLPLAALADGHSEIVNAAAHAGFAASSADIKMVHAHLHHTLNCLVGPGGGGFDAHEMNPCANAGNGAITDAKTRALRTSLEAAADKTRYGIAEGDLAKAQSDAADAEAMLKALQ